MWQNDGMQTPLIYLERLPQVERTFQLFADRVEIDARWTLGRRFRTTVNLAELAPLASTFTVRNKWFKKAVLVGSLAAGAALLIGRNTYFPQVQWASMLFWPVAGVGLLVAVRSFPKRQFARFRRKDGKPGLDLCRTDPERYEAFLRELQARIRRA